MKEDNKPKIGFETKYFQRKVFSEKAVLRYFNSALKDIKIACSSNYPEVMFKFSYDALIKTGITVIAFYGYKVKSRQGHHIMILEKFSQILREKEIGITGDRMRKKRNLDLYEGGTLISKKEAKNYLIFTKKIFLEAEKHVKKQRSLFEKDGRKK